MTTMKRSVIALYLPKSVPLLIVFGRHIVLALTGNTWLPSPSPALSAVTSDIDALEAAEVAARQRTKGAAAARDLEQKVVEEDLLALKAYVQQVANQHPDQAEAIVTSAGMTLRRSGRARKPVLAASMGPSPDEVTLRAKARGRGAAYEWQSSSDGGKSWTNLGITTQASLRVPGLTVGTTYLFRFRATVKATTSDWSDAVSLAVI